jgi:hypothetical protein
MMAGIVPVASLWCQEKRLQDIVVRLRGRELEIKTRPAA